MTERKRGSRFAPKDWAPDDALLAWTRLKAPALNISLELEKFRDHEFKSAYTDWDRVWRNWVRNTFAYGKQHFVHVPKHPARLDVFGDRVGEEKPWETRTRLEKERRAKLDLPVFD